MLKKSTSFFLITLIVGLIYGCGGTTNPFLEDVQDNLKSGDLNSVLTAAENSIQNRPGDPLGYYYKGVALGDLADEKPASDRSGNYTEMNTSFETAQAVADTVEADVSQELGNISSFRVSLWAKEFNKGIDYVTKDSVSNSVPNPQEVAVSHLQNATIILPDSSRTWNVLAQIAYNAGNLEMAIDSKEEFFKRAEKPSADDYTIIAAYYINNGNSDKAISRLQEGIELYPNSEGITTTLADAYQRSGQSEKSIAIVKDLVENNPDNIKYRINLASQIYQSALKLDEKTSANFDQIEELKTQQQNVSGSQKEELQGTIDNLTEENNELLAEYDSLTERAIEQLQTALEYEPMNADANNILGIIHQNIASNLFDERNRTDDIDKASEIDERGKDVLRESMKYYETAVEADPDNKEYWRSLFNIYVTLGMDEKADEAEKKAGLDQ